MILGIDEAGRGPWAGPLVVGAVVLGGVEIVGLNDSKKLSKKHRETLEREIHKQASAWALGWVSANELDEMGMSEALRLATRRAVEQIHVPYHEIIIDGVVNFLKGTAKGEYVTILPKADALIPSVSAASIIAKVARDRYMAALDEVYPGYGFAKHAGYGVAAHRAAIERLGVTPEHRLSFAPLQKYGVRLCPLPSSQPQAAARRSLDTGEDSPGLSARESSGENLFSTAKFRGRGTWPVARATPSLSPAKSVASVGVAPSRATRLSTTRAIGNASETAAANELVRLGHAIVERNWKTKYCEIDIISKKGDTLYFTEVKHRKNDKAGDGLAAITPKKLRQMEFAARLYVHNKYLTDVNLRLVGISTVGTEPTVVSIVEL